MQAASSLYIAAISIPALLLAVILHEIAHGWIAYKLGDPTAKLLGRLTLNPIKHIDPFMTILLPGILILSGSPIIFGGAKPVPVDVRNFVNPRRDMTYVAAAGPATNFILGFLSWIVLIAMASDTGQGLIAPLIGTTIYTFILLSLTYSIVINAVLALFNLTPVPPLDGGRIAVGLLPEKFAKPLARLEPYGILIIIALLFSGVLQSVLGPVLNLIYQVLPQ